jgi:lantibiotic modifying enzyme
MHADKTNLWRIENWARALRLAERIPYYKASPSIEKRHIDAQGATKRLEKWRSQKPFDQGDFFEKRLAAEKIDLSRFEEILGLDPKIFVDDIKEKPDWLQFLERAYTDFADSKDYPAHRLKENPGVGLCYLAQPLADLAIRLFDARIQEIKAEFALPIELEKAAHLFLDPLFYLLLRTMNKALILELNVSRLRGELAGQTTEERFESYLKKLRQDDYRTYLLLEYPVLARKLAEIAIRWKDVRIEFMERLARDWPELTKRFYGGEDPGPLISVVDSGDRHCGGRSVAVLEFRSGKKLVYKPRSLEVDHQYFQILSWLDRHCEWGFEPMKISNHGDYGWVEFIEHKSCKDKKTSPHVLQTVGRTARVALYPRGRRFSL